MNEQKFSDIWNNLGNLECTLFKLEEIENLLVILEEGYFDKPSVDLNNSTDMYTLYRDYKYRQSLLFTIERCLSLYNNELKDNIYLIYDIIKELKTENKCCSQDNIILEKSIA